MIQTTPNFNGLSYCVHELILDSIAAAVRVMSPRSLSEVTKRRSSFLFVNGCLPDQSIFGRQLVKDNGRSLLSYFRPAGSYGSVRASVSSQPTESSVRLKTQPIYTSSYSLKPFTVNSTATSGGSAHFSTPAGTGSTSVRDTFSARGTPR